MVLNYGLISLVWDVWRMIKGWRNAWVHVEMVLWMMGLRCVCDVFAMCINVVAICRVTWCDLCINVVAICRVTDCMLCDVWLIACCATCDRLHVVWHVTDCMLCDVWLTEPINMWMVTHNMNEFSINNDSISDVVIYDDFLSYEVFEEWKKDEGKYAGMLKGWHGLMGWRVQVDKKICLNSWNIIFMNFSQTTVYCIQTCKLWVPHDSPMYVVSIDCNTWKLL